MKIVPPVALTDTATRADDERYLPGALILGGAHVSIGLARSLGRHGVPVCLLANHPLPRFSRYVRQSHVWPGGDDKRALPSLLEIAERLGLAGWVLLPTGDQDMRMVAENHAVLAARFRLTTPDWDTIRWMFDKRLTYQRAAALGVDHPLTFYPRSLEEARALDCRYPVIVKPAYRWGDDEFTLAKAWRADDRETLLAHYARAAALVGADAAMIQECIPGSGAAQFSYGGLWHRGEPVASIVARRTRQHPIDFGRSSTFVESIEQDEIEDAASRFLGSFGYSGIAELEFKFDARDRRYKLLDVNGRFWTWNGLGALAGTDFGYLAWRLALGLPVEPCRARTGVAWMHASRDLVAAWQEIKAGRLSPRDYLNGWRQPLVFANFAPDDPLPALIELPLALANRLADRAGSAARRALRFVRGGMR
jgi:predicted ATP-grasp superfamily ATP-dependent carboligase